MQDVSMEEISIATTSDFETAENFRFEKDFMIFALSTHRICAKIMPENKVNVIV